MQTTCTFGAAFFFFFTLFSSSSSSYETPQFPPLSVLSLSPPQPPPPIPGFSTPPLPPSPSTTSSEFSFSSYSLIHTNAHTHARTDFNRLQQQQQQQLARFPFPSELLWKGVLVLFTTDYSGFNNTGEYLFQNVLFTGWMYHWYFYLDLTRSSDFHA